MKSMNLSIDSKLGSETFGKRFIKRNNRYYCVDIDVENFLGDDREKYINMLVEIEERIWIPMHREERSHWESMTDSQVIQSLKRLEDVENNPV
jgi:hypothetical protein